MGVSHGAVCSNWVASIEGRKDFRHRPSHLRGCNVSAQGDVINSYGWWEMARIIRTRTGEPNFWLINGDRYSPSTSQHQSQVRAAIEGSSLPRIIIPYTALAAAGIERDAILPIEIRADRFIEHRHSIPADFAMPALRPQKMGSEARCEKGELRVHDVKFSVTHWSRYYDYELQAFADVDETSYYINGCEARLVDDHWHWETRTHFLGDSLFSARVVEQRDRPATPEEIELSEYSERWAEAYREAGWPARDTLEHTAIIERLGPEPHDSVVTHKRADGDYMVRERIERRVRFLSSFDYNERIPLYFLCELPRGKVETVEEAYELLKPRLVKMAEAGGIEVTRQGDIFAVPTELTTKEVRRLTPHGNGQIVKRPAVLGTNHEPSQVMFATGDRVYARGCLYHAPGEWRAPDHARRKMGDGKTWHLLMRNTVPRTTDPDARRSVRA
jgi:hypothetical protein